MVISRDLEYMFLFKKKTKIQSTHIDNLPYAKIIIFV